MAAVIYHINTMMIIAAIIYHINIMTIIAAIIYRVNIMTIMAAIVYHTDTIHGSGHFSVKKGNEQYTVLGCGNLLLPECCMET